MDANDEAQAAFDAMILSGHADQLAMTALFNRLESDDLRLIQALVRGASMAPDYGSIMVGRIGTINEFRFGADPFTGKRVEDLQKR